MAYSILNRPAIGQIRAERHGGDKFTPSYRPSLAQAGHGPYGAYGASGNMLKPDPPGGPYVVAHASLIRPDCRCLSLSRRYLATGSHRILAQTFRPGARMITLTAFMVLSADITNIVSISYQVSG